MSEEAKGGAPKKLTTAEILAMARAKAGAASSPAPTAAPKEVAPAPSEAVVESVAETPAAPAPAATPAAAGKPKSTAEILAAARAAKAGGAAPAPAADKPKAAAAPVAAGAKPKSTADILAAARAAKAGAAAPASTSDAPAPKSNPQPAVAKGAATGLSVQEMLAAMRPAGEVAPAQQAVVSEKEKSVLAAPPMPAKPMPAKKPAAKAGADATSRRGFLLGTLLSAWVVSWTSFVGACTVGALGCLRFMLPNVLTEPPRKFKIGSPGDYDLGTVATKWVAQYGIWVVHTDQYKGNNLIYALISVCTHLGCTPSWLEGEQKFKCPCHGSGFYITGVNFEGPAPRPLERAGIRIAEDGMLEVDKSLKFQEEMQQWEDPNSFVAVS